ncbi:MAG: DUF5683 domain-containing protein [Bacteroidales bacterium]|jgi:hypothetical protein|nr:DUF5683 domain-containing protein [Bacteroidales bacterium]
MNKWSVIIAGLLLLQRSVVQAQTPDTTHIPDSGLMIISETPVIEAVELTSGMRTPIPAKATIMSAVLPGLGQAYNGKYWKIPIAYALIGASTYFLIYSQNRFLRFRRYYIDLKDGDPYTNYHETLDFPPTYTAERKDRYITTYKDSWRRYRDWAIVAVAISYLMNVVDANVDAHLFNYNVDDDLSLQINPVFFKDIRYSTKIGVNLCLRF